MAALQRRSSNGSKDSVVHSAMAVARWQQRGGCGSGGSTAAAHIAMLAGNGWGDAEGNGDRGRRTRGWHNERTEIGNVTTSWTRGTSMIQFLSCDTNLCELVHTNL